MSHKKNYACSLKEAYARAANNEKISRSFLTVGSHGIHKMDYNNYMNSQEYRLFEDNFSLQKRLRPSIINNEIRSTGPKWKEKDGHNRVVVLKKTESSKLEDLLLRNHTTATKQASIKIMERTNSLIRTTREGKNYNME